MALLLNAAEVEAALDMPALIGEIERALVAFSTGQARQPIRATLEAGPRGDWFAAMPAYLEDPPSLGAKLVTVFEGNAIHGLPTHLATIILLDPQTGQLDAIIDARSITAMRTAAASAVSVKHVARPDSSVLAIIGSGVQARSHSHYRVFSHFEQARAWSPTPEHLSRFTAETGVRAVRNAESAAAGADVIVLATTARDAVIRSEWVKDGAHVVSIGAYRPDMREMDPALVHRARVFVDSHEAAIRESGDIIQSRAAIAGELGEVIAGKVLGRRSADEVTIFKSLGLAVEDIAAARLVVTRARQAGIGKEIRL
jgi:ornithine cyclodeaminase/alanine dehydrogenase-like protein (mu-crystallin family)